MPTDLLDKVNQKIRDKILGDLERLTYHQEQKSFSQLRFAFSSVIDVLKNLQFLADYDHFKSYEVCRELLIDVLEMPNKVSNHNFQLIEIINHIKFNINRSLDILSIFDFVKETPDKQMLIDDCKHLLNRAKKILENECDENINKYLHSVGTISHLALYPNLQYIIDNSEILPPIEPLTTDPDLTFECLEA